VGLPENPGGEREGEEAPGLATVDGHHVSAGDIDAVKRGRELICEAVAVNAFEACGVAGGVDAVVGRLKSSGREVDLRRVRGVEINRGVEGGGLFHEVVEDGSMGRNDGVPPKFVETSAEAVEGGHHEASVGGGEGLSEDEETAKFPAEEPPVVKGDVMEDGPKKGAHLEVLGSGARGDPNEGKDAHAAGDGGE